MEKVAKDLAKKLGAYEFQELAAKLVAMSFENAYKVLGGHNLNEVEGLFDLNYKDICVTVHKDKFGCCSLSPYYEVWHDEYSTPIANYKF